MGWDDRLLDFAGNISQGVIQTKIQAFSLPSKGFYDYIEEKPRKRYVQGEAGRHHDNETVIPNERADHHGKERQVQLACRVVPGGFAGASLSKLTKAASDAAFPNTGVANPMYHWCIIVGDYLHQLQVTSFRGGWNYYTNERLSSVLNGWSCFPVGTTTLNDVAVRDAATSIMNSMPEVYNALGNNCQTFALRLIDRILHTAHTRRYRRANSINGIRKAPQIDIKMVPRPVLKRMDTDEVIDSKALDSLLDSEATEDTPAHGEPTVVADDEAENEEEKPQTEIPRAQMLCSMARIMIRNTPTLSREDATVPQVAPIILASQVAPQVAAC